MTININTLLTIGVAILTGVLGWTINAQKKAIESAIGDLKMEIGKLQALFKEYMPKELCESEHRTHGEQHNLIMSNINGVGKKIEGVEIRVTEIERGMS